MTFIKFFTVSMLALVLTVHTYAQTPTTINQFLQEFDGSTTIQNPSTLEAGAELSGYYDNEDEIAAVGTLNNETLTEDALDGLYDDAITYLSYRGYVVVANANVENGYLIAYLTAGDNPDGNIHEIYTIEERDWAYPNLTHRALHLIFMGTHDLTYEPVGQSDNTAIVADIKTFLQDLDGSTNIATPLTLNVGAKLSGHYDNYDPVHTVTSTDDDGVTEDQISVLYDFTLDNLDFFGYIVGENTYVENGYLVAYPAADDNLDGHTYELYTLKERDWESGNFKYKSLDLIFVGKHNLAYASILNSDDGAYYALDSNDKFIAVLAENDKWETIENNNQHKHPADQTSLDALMGAVFGVDCDNADNDCPTHTQSILRLDSTDNLSVADPYFDLHSVAYQKGDKVENLKNQPFRYGTDLEEDKVTKIRGKYLNKATRFAEYGFTTISSNQIRFSEKDRKLYFEDSTKKHYVIGYVMPYRINSGTTNFLIDYNGVFWGNIEYRLVGDRVMNLDVFPAVPKLSGAGHLDEYTIPLIKDYGVGHQPSSFIDAITSVVWNKVLYGTQVLEEWVSTSEGLNTSKDVLNAIVTSAIAHTEGVVPQLHLVGGKTAEIILQNYRDATIGGNYSDTIGVNFENTNVCNSTDPQYGGSSSFLDDIGPPPGGFSVMGPSGRVYYVASVALLKELWDHASSLAALCYDFADGDMQIFALDPYTWAQNTLESILGAGWGTKTQFVVGKPALEQLLHLSDANLASLEIVLFNGDAEEGSAFTPQLNVGIENDTLSDAGERLAIALFLKFSNSEYASVSYDETNNRVQLIIDKDAPLNIHQDIDQYLTQHGKKSKRPRTINATHKSTGRQIARAMSATRSIYGGSNANGGGGGPPRRWMRDVQRAYSAGVIQSAFERILNVLFSNVRLTQTNGVFSSTATLETESAIFGVAHGSTAIQEGTAGLVAPYLAYANITNTQVFAYFPIVMDNNQGGLQNPLGYALSNHPFFRNVEYIRSMLHPASGVRPTNLSIIIDVPDPQGNTRLVRLSNVDMVMTDVPDAAGGPAVPTVVLNLGNTQYPIPLSQLQGWYNFP